MKENARDKKHIAALPQPTIYAMTDNMHLPQLYTQCKIFLSHTTMLRHISAPILTLITIIIMVITTVIIITNTIPICTIFWWWRCEKERGEWETVALDSIAGTPASSPPAWDTFTHTNFTHTTFLQCGNSSTNSITHLRHFYFTGQPIITCVWSKLYNFLPVYFCWVNTSDIGLVGQFEPEQRTSIRNWWLSKL